ncbi:hypothetical protein VQ056_21595 [Paenibacillus sp. JTLBN-2024]
MKYAQHGEEGVVTGLSNKLELYVSVERHPLCIGQFHHVLHERFRKQNPTADLKPYEVLVIGSGSKAA